MFLLTPIYAVLTFLFTILTYILAPILSLTADTAGYLPRYLRYFGTFDASLDEGWLNGYFKSPSYLTRNRSLFLWWMRTRWLWRNPSYTFDYEVLGIRWFDYEWEVLHDSSSLFFALNTKQAAFNLNINIWRLRFKLGWKAWKAWNHYNSATKRFDGGNWSMSERVPFVFSISLRSPK